MAVRRGTNPNPGAPGSMPVGGPYATTPVPPLPYTVIHADGTTTTGGGTTPTATADTPAKAQLKLALDAWGLGSLVDWAWGQLTSGASQEQVLLSLREQTAYKERFAGNIARQNAGLPPLSEAQYIAYEGQARQMMRAAGLPPDLFDAPSDFADYIAKDISVSELSSRVAIAQRYATTDPTVSAEERAAMTRLYGAGGLAAYYLDPQRALPALQAQVVAAQSAAAAQLAGFGALDKSQAERVAGLSSGVQETQQAFAQLVRQRELMTALPGEVGVDTITADEQINAAFGDANAQQELTRRARARAALGQSSTGQYAGSSLGSSRTSAL